MRVVNSAVQTVKIAPHGLSGDLVVPEHAQGAVLFAHGSGSSRRSPRNQYVAGVLQQGTPRSRSISRAATFALISAQWCGM
jgi:hypothetical protein